MKLWNTDSIVKQFDEICVSVYHPSLISRVYKQGLNKEKEKYLTIASTNLFLFVFFFCAGNSTFKHHVHEIGRVVVLVKCLLKTKQVLFFYINYRCAVLSCTRGLFESAVNYSIC